MNPPPVPPCSGHVLSCCLLIVRPIPCPAPCPGAACTLAWPWAWQGASGNGTELTDRAPPLGSSQSLHRVGTARRLVTDRPESARLALPLPVRARAATVPRLAARGGAVMSAVIAPVTLFTKILRVRAGGDTTAARRIPHTRLTLSGAERFNFWCLLACKPDPSQSYFFNRGRLSTEPADCTRTNRGAMGLEVYTAGVDERSLRAGSGIVDAAVSDLHIPRGLLQNHHVRATMLTRRRDPPSHPRR